MFKYPIDLGGRSFISTPDILWVFSSSIKLVFGDSFSLLPTWPLSSHPTRYQYFPNRRGFGGFGAPPPRRPVVAQEPMGGSGGGGRHNWGQGFRLGADWTKMRGERSHAPRSPQLGVSQGSGCKCLLPVIILCTEGNTPFQKPNLTSHSDLYFSSSTLVRMKPSLPSQWS